MDRTPALQIMERLVAANIKAKLKYETRWNSYSGFNNYSVSVSANDSKRAREILNSTSATGIEADMEPEEGEVDVETETDDGIFSCPRCGCAKCRYLEGSDLLFSFLTAFTCGLGLLIWFIFIRPAGPRLECKLCKHRWRVRP